MFKKLIESLTVVGIIVSVKMSVVEMQSIPSASMNPALEENDFILVDQMAYNLRVPITGHVIYKFSEPQRGDVITFANDDTKSRYIKRVIGISGDVIDVDDFRISVNGDPLGCDLLGSFGDRFICGENGYVVAYDSERPEKAKQISARYIVPNGSVFVMGDNRDRSLDSRYLPSTFVKLEDVQGKAVKNLFNVGALRFGSLAVPLPFVDGGERFDFPMYLD